MTDQERVARGHRATNELNEVSGAFDAVEASILRAIADTPITQEAKVLKLHMAVQNLAAVRQALKAVIDDGLMAEHALSVSGLTRPN